MLASPSETHIVHVIFPQRTQTTTRGTRVCSHHRETGNKWTRDTGWMGSLFGEGAELIALGAMDRRKRERIAPIGECGEEFIWETSKRCKPFLELHDVQFGSNGIQHQIYFLTRGNENEQESNPSYDNTSNHEQFNRACKITKKNGKWGNSHSKDYP